MTESSSLYRRISFRILPILFCCYLLNYIDRVNVSFAKEHIATALGIDAAAYGFGAGLFFIGYFFLQVPSNLLLQRIGARRCISLIMILWGSISACTAFARNETDFYVIRFFLGASEAGFFPGVILYLTWWYPAALRARIFAIFLTAIPVAGLLGGPVSGWILENAHGFSLHDWQWLFVLEAAPCAFASLWVFTCLPDHPRNARWLSEADRDQLEATLRHEARQRAATGAVPLSAAKAFRHPLVWKLCLLYFCTMMGLYGLTFWLPKIIKDLGWTGDLKIGLLSAIPWSVAIVFMLFLGARSDRKQERRLHATFAAAVAAAGFALCGFAQGGAIGLVALCLIASGVIGMMAVQWSMPSNLLGGTAAAAGIALVNSFGNLGGFVSPYVIGKITKETGSPTWGLITTAAILLFAALLLRFSPALEPRPSARNDS